MDFKKIYKDEEGNDVFLIATYSKEEIEKMKRKREEKFKRSLEKLKKALAEIERMHKRDE
jgi:ribosomal protein S2